MPYLALFVCWAFLGLLLVTAVYPQTKKLRSLHLYDNAQYTWNEASNYCHAQNSHLLYVDGEAVMNAFKYFTTPPQTFSSWNYEEAWIGLFKSDVNTLQLKWQGVCVATNIGDVTNWESGSPNIDVEKNCVYIKDSTYFFNFENCGQDYKAVCEKTEGPCYFERRLFLIPASGDYNASIGMITESFEACECLCQNLLLGSNDECWAVTFNLLSKFCQPYIGVNPYEFETTLQNIVFITSYKRCFEMVYKQASLPESNSHEPVEKCSSSMNSSEMTCNAENTISTSTLQTTSTTTFLSTTTTELTSSSTVLTTSTTEPSTSTTELTSSTTELTTSTTEPSTSTTKLTSSTTEATTFITETAPSLLLLTTEASTTVQTSMSTTQTTAGGGSTLTTVIENPTTNGTILPFLPKPSCLCTCINVQDNRTEEEIILDLMKEMTINKSNLQSYLRTKTCATDDRDSSKNIGTIGVVLMCILSFILLAFDFISVKNPVKGK